MKQNSQQNNAGHNGELKIMQAPTQGSVFRLSASMKIKNRSVASLTLGLALLGSSPAQSALVSYWNFNSNMNDSVSANNGAITGSVPYVAGKFGSATSYSTGALNYVSVPSSASLTTFTPGSGFAISLWINAPASSGIGVPFSKFTTGSGVYGLFSDGNWYAGSSTFIPVTAGAYGNSNWNNAVFRWTGSNVISYLNGAQQGSAALTNFLAGSQPLLFGNDNRGVSLGAQFNGLLDDVSIFNTALTVAQVQSIYNVGNSTLSYSMADMNGLFALYASGAGTTNTSDGKTWQYNASGLAGGAGQLVGSNTSYSVIFSDAGSAGVSTVPEPSTAGLILGSALLSAWLLRRKGGRE